MAKYIVSEEDPLYPDSDGEPIAEDTLQFDWISKLYGNLVGMFSNDPDVFVAADLLWYPVEGAPEIRIAPDAMVVFGRPSGDRHSYRQWNEGGVAPHVVFEIFPKRDLVLQAVRKFRFYERFGVEEYYAYHPHENQFAGWQRRGAALEEIDHIDGWVSPRLRVRFAITEATLQIIRPDGRPFLTYSEYARRADEAKRRADEAKRRADAEQQRAERLLARLRELGEDSDA